MASMTRADFLRLAALGALGMAGEGCKALAPFWPRDSGRKKPNIVLFLADDLGWADVGCNGSRFYETPNIDRLARSGVLFTDAYAASPLCSPTRASILTGKSPAQLHLTTAIVYPSKKPGAKAVSRPAPKPTKEKPHNPPWEKCDTPNPINHLPLEETTIAEALKAKGYRTAIFGKWHLGKEPHYPENQGFDVNFGGTFQPSPPSYFDPYKVPNIPDRQKGEYITDRLTEEAERFLEANRDDPFFLYFPHYAVHGPWQAKPELTEKYRKKADPSAPQHNPVYAAMIDSMDQSLGRIMKKLDDLNLSDNTIVIFMSDNGGELNAPVDNYFVTSNSPLRAGKATLYEGGIRVPLAIRWPGVTKPGSVCHTPVISNDLFSTILDAAGAKAPKGAEGVSIAPLLRETGNFERDAIYFHFPHYIAGYRPDPSKRTYLTKPCSAIRQGDFKLIHFYEERTELYNLRDDIGETRNLAAAMPEKVAELRAKLDRWLRGAGAQIPTPNPRFDPKLTAIPGKPTPKEKSIGRSR